MNELVEVQSQYGAFFARFFHDCIQALVKSEFQRSKNPSAPFKFGENHLREYIRTILKNGSYQTPSNWPKLCFEQKVADDFGENGKPNGGVDYFFVNSDIPKLHDLKEVLATCEMKGPTRSKLLQGSKVNWYEAILIDFRKQLTRVKSAPAGEHYSALLVKPLPKGDIRKDFSAVLDSIKEEIGAIKLVEISWVELKEFDNLNVIIFRILGKQ